MKKSLFKNNGAFYKANLHNHTVISDGKHTPEEIKKIYMDQGYSVIAYSDHDIMVPHPELTDNAFLALTAFEYEFSEELEDLPWNFTRCYHTVVIAPEENCTYYPWPNPDYVWGNARQYIQDYYVGDCPHGYDVENINNLIKDAHEHGFLVTYCHPHWSTQLYPDYCGIKDVDLVETYNAGCVVAGWNMDADDHVYHDLLKLKQRCFPTASDDGHSDKDYCGGATYIKSPELKYDAVINALKQGDVYASWGPEIKDIAYDPETKQLTVECSEASEIFLITDRRYAKREISHYGYSICRASFDIADYIDETVEYHQEENSFIRIVVVDGSGKRALSRGYFVDELV